MTEWFVKAREFSNCNCSYGCPCQFNALPTHGNCMASIGYQIDEGRFGDVKLDGLRAVATYKWPGAVHQGNGTMQLIIDERADGKQRDALLRVMSGKETKDMATVWWVYAAMCPTKLEPLFKPIEFEVDVDARRARLVVPGVVETVGEPIRNPVTGAEHRARIDLPNGFEYRLGEVASGTTKATAGIPLEMNKSWGLFANIHLSHAGVVA
ncbi:MAG TPA: DUF1326 domain-containing protein [Casimicrobiaceae bacterium]|nr:DUF1326 domain-containing protein [Casimicrobiaceae bacterium]